MSLQERTLVIKNFDPEKTTDKLLKELCIQAGPVRNVVLRPDHAFVEFEDVESVGYSKALLDGVELFGNRLLLETKIRSPVSNKYSRALLDYINYERHQRALLEAQKQFVHQQQPQFNLGPQHYRSLPQLADLPQFQGSLQQTGARSDQACSHNFRGASNPDQFLVHSDQQSRRNNDDNPTRSRSFNHYDNKSGRRQSNRGPDFYKRRR